MRRRRVIAMPKLSSPLKILATAVIGGLALAGCGTSDSADGEATGEPQSGGTLTYASGDAEPDCLDPHYGGNYPQGLIATQYLETLFTKDEDGQTIPWLADTSEVTDDGLTHTISVEAIITNIEHLQDPETASSTGFLAVEKVEEIEIVDELTADLHLSAPDNALEESLSMHWTAIQSPEALARDVQENCADPVGTGPFMFDSWEREQQVNLVRNDDYVLPVESDRETDQAYLDGITWRMIPEAATRYAALQSGEVDVIDNAQPDTIQSAEDANIGHLDSPRPGAANRLELNSSQALFDDVL